MKIFISTTSFGKIAKEPLSLLRAKGIRYALNPHKRRLAEDEISDILNKSSYVALIAGTEPLGKDVLGSARGLKVISRVGAGLDNVDLDAAKRLNIKVYNTPGVLTDSVAELTIGLILNCLRKVSSMDRNMRNRVWKKEMGLLFKGKALGIIGLGRIGRRVAQLAKAFGAVVTYYDIKNIKDSRFAQVPLKRLLALSDIISVHSSSKEKIITKREISKMKDGAILINTSRGSIIDEGALYSALKFRKIAFAGLDVQSREPYYGKLTKLDNVILTPHVGSYAKEPRLRMEIEAVENLFKGLREVNLL